MTFLQPILLTALPLIALPIIIHLINQRRFQTIRWAGMMFLLAANRMSRGYAKLRQFLILLFRTLAVAGLIFAVSRPLASGWLGRAASGRPDTTIVLLDRSPSMQQHGIGTAISKLDAGRHQLARTLALLGSGRWVLIESTSNAPQIIESPDALLKVPSAEPADTSADLPAMLEAARDYIRDNQTGRTDIWICSDVRQNDWNAESVRWRALHDSFLEFPQGIHFHLLAYPDVANGNVSVRVTNVRRLQTGDGAELLVSLKLTREGAADSKLSLPVQFEIEGARSELNVEMNGLSYELRDHRIPIEGTRERGWGKVSIPADANPADNAFYFVFDRPQPRKALVVSDDAKPIVAMQLAAAIAPDAAIRCSAELIKREQLTAAEWDSLSLLVWHAPLPEADAARAVEAFVQRGGQVIFLPPRAPGDGDFMGIRWQGWTEGKSDISVENWRGDQDILANTQSGAALPVGQLQIHHYCTLTGELTPLARLKNGQPLLARLPTSSGGVYFCATTPDATDSSLAENGVVLYVLAQRAMAAGAAVLGQARQLVAGDAAGEQPANWQQVTGAPDALSTEYLHHSGVYSAGEKLLAVNRAETEDQAAVLSDEGVAELFKGLDYTRVDARAGDFTMLIEEVWRLFLVAMLIAMLVEAVLCLPGRPKESPSDAFTNRAFTRRPNEPPAAAAVGASSGA
jgi:Aerotolerance regulator N-terminal